MLNDSENDVVKALLKAVKETGKNVVYCDDSEEQWCYPSENCFPHIRVTRAFIGLSFPFVQNGLFIGSQRMLKLIQILCILHGIFDSMEVKTIIQGALKILKQQSRQTWTSYFLSFFSRQQSKKIPFKDVVKAFKKAIKEIGKKQISQGQAGQWFYPNPKRRPHIHCSKDYIGCNSYNFVNQGFLKAIQKIQQFISSLDSQKDTEYAQEVKNICIRALEILQCETNLTKQSKFKKDDQQEQKQKQKQKQKQNQKQKQKPKEKQNQKQKQQHSKNSKAVRSVMVGLATAALTPVVVGAATVAVVAVVAVATPVVIIAATKLSSIISAKAGVYALIKKLAFGGIGFATLLGKI